MAPNQNPVQSEASAYGLCQGPNRTYKRRASFPEAAETGEETAIKTTLKHHFGFHTFRPGQRQAIENILQGQHTLVVMPTGTGKSLIYQFAALHVQGLTVVVSPLIALMEDQVSALRQRDISATYINSTVPAHQRRRRLQKITDRKYQIVYVAPERFRNLEFRETLQQINVGLLAIDEAHCISEWGHDFRPDYRRIAEARALMGNPLTTALTATATPRVQEDIANSLGLSMCRVVTGFNRPNLTFEVLETHNTEAKLTALHNLLSQLSEQEKQSGVLIYTGTRNNAEEAAAFLRQVTRLDARHYHAGLNGHERSTIQEAFVTGRLPIVAATNAFGMGIDRPDVRLVIHYQIPGSVEAYYQEAGRAGRDGLPARAILFYNPADRALQDYFIRTSLPSASDLRTLYDTLHARKHASTTLTIDDLSVQGGLAPVKAKIALEQLELAGAIKRQGDDGVTLHLRVHPWSDEAVQLRLKELERIAQYRRQQLQEMIAYAETDNCRRRQILQHFGDSGAAPAARCCDNCLSSLPSLSSQATAEQTPKGVILACVRALPGQLPRSGVAKVLAGSKSKRIQKYQTSPFYGRLKERTRKAITALVDELIEEGDLILVGKKVTIPAKSPYRQAPEALSGPNLEQQIVAWGEGKRKDRVPDLLAALTDERYNVRRLAASALGKLRDSRAVNPLLDLLSREEHPQIRQYAVKALGKIGDARARAMLLQIASDENEKYYTRDSARSALKRLKRFRSKDPSAAVKVSRQTIPLDQRINRFLQQARPQRLDGPWDSGWALDYHSRIEDNEWERSHTGHLLYKLKYEDSREALLKLGARLVQFCRTRPDISDVDALVPIPPSTRRSSDPVLALARNLGRALNLPTLPLLEKIRPTAPQKDMHTLAQKQRNVSGAFVLARPVKGRRLLLIDDLYDSGATLAEAARVLRSGGAIKISALAVTKTIHTDA